MSFARQAHHNGSVLQLLLSLCSHLPADTMPLLPCYRLVSAAEVPKTPSWFANALVWLPTAATARLPVRFEFS